MKTGMFMMMMKRDIHFEPQTFVSVIPSASLPFIGRKSCNKTVPVIYCSLLMISGEDDESELKSLFQNIYPGLRQRPVVSPGETFWQKSILSF